MNNTENHKGERLSFHKLFIEKEYIIEIPIIQRDYAQGRKSKKTIRNNFLKALKKYLIEGKPNRDLDFVYGTLEKLNDKYFKFIPLDGQQRLTTLFLLHWYLALKENKMDHFKSYMLFNEKSRFTYETRTSSSEFCNKLVVNSIKYEELLKPFEEDLSRKNELFERSIKNTHWYFLNWNDDPTVQAMLVMLDAIHKEFKDMDNFYPKLVNENPIITFQFLNLKDLGLSDSLYIQMNARGKMLTDFENFKAKIEQFLQGSSNIKEFELTFNNGKHKVDLRTFFSHKMDTDWTESFWRFKDEKDNKFDYKIMNFIRALFSIQKAFDIKNEDYSSLEFLIGTGVAKKLENYTDNFTFSLFEELDTINLESIRFFIDTLIILSNNKDGFNKFLKNDFYFDEKNIIEQIISYDNKFTLPNRVQLYAYLKYLIKFQDTSGLFHWMRVVYNLSENTAIDGADNVSEGIKDIDRLLPYANDILTYFSKLPVYNFLNNPRQVEEESLKAILIKKSKLWENEILKIEQHPYFKGQIGFILDFSGILNYFIKNNNLNWNDQQDILFIDSFNNYASKADIVFRDHHANINTGFLWERAVLSKGDYLIRKRKSHKRNFLTTNRFMRDFSWKRLLRLTPTRTTTNNKATWDERRGFVKDVFDDEYFNLFDVEASLNAIIEQKPNDWRRPFIDHPELMQYCKQGYINFKSVNDIILFGQSQMNHYHAEHMSYILYIELKKKINKEPFKDFWFKEVKNADDESLISFNTWIYKRINYKMIVWYDTESNSYEINFMKNTNRNEDNIQEEIKQIVNGFKMEFNKQNYYSLKIESKVKVKETILDLLTDFRKLQDD